MLSFFEPSADRITKSVGKQNAHFPILPDPDRIIYKQYGVEGNIAKFLSGVLFQPKKLMSATRKGFLPGQIDNDITMIPADFLIDETGTIELAYYGKDASDHLPLQEIEYFLNN
jgi:peroxiredoxin